MTNEEVLNRFRTFRAVKLQPVWSYMCERRLTRPDEHVIKGGKGRASNFRRLWGGIVSLLFVSRTKTRVLRTRDDLCYHRGPFPECAGKAFNNLLVQTSFSRTSEDIYGYTRPEMAPGMQLQSTDLALCNFQQTSPDRVYCSTKFSTRFRFSTKFSTR